MKRRLARLARYVLRYGVLATPLACAETVDTSSVMATTTNLIVAVMPLFVVMLVVKMLFQTFKEVG